ncbi:MAG: hypothetical protein M3N53_09040 [Actinomycetota bacterium]|nr:hypothetical protein [Actinomycetota bacterium]
MTTAETTSTASANGSAKALGFGFLALGVAMVAMALLAPVDSGARAAEAVGGALAAMGGALLLARGAHAGMTAGTLTLAASLVYLAVTNDEFHQGGVGYSIAVAQFVTVPIGLVLGGIAFALTPGPRTTGRVGDFIPDGVVLVVGTILLGIGLGQIGNERLMTPMWNWISFLGLTVTGMLVLVVARGALKAAVGGERRSRPAFRFLGALATELLLVGGLALMMYGALNNLVLGANGFRTGFKGNGGGLALWIGAALFLVVVRGGFKFVARNQQGAAQAVVRELLYFAGVFAFIVGERSVLSGKPPGVPIGGALPAAAVILLGALFLLVPVRMAAKQGRLRARHG